MHPKVIYLCNKLITENEITASNKWKELNPDYEIRLYDDLMIKNFLLNECGDIYLKIFDFLTHGPIKADFWRICILYKNGGIYSDIDNVPLIKLENFIEKEVDFVTCSSYWDGKFNFNPNFIISDKNNLILKKCIDWYIAKFLKKELYSYWGWSIMQAFTDVLSIKNYKKDDGIYYLEDLKIQIIKECRGQNHYDAHNIYKGNRVFNNRDVTWNCVTHSFNPKVIS